VSTPPATLDRCALVVVDVQRGLDDPVWGRRNNPDCERNIGALIAEWRAQDRPVVFVRHDSVRPESPLRPELPGNAFKDVVAGEPDLLVTKSVRSAFYGEPDLHGWLRERGLDAVAVCGITTNHCCETTARMAGDLGYDVLFVDDATYTFDTPGPDGTVVTAEELQRATAASLHGEFATVVRTGELLAG
jgi:nicotinamidase-related amidase